MRTKSQVIVCVTEGVNLSLLKSWAESGLLPGFSRLLKEGSHGGLRSEFVPYEPPGLITAFTGKSASDHGWLSYWTVHERDYRPCPLTSDQLGHRFLWQREELADKRFAVINIFGTHPPTPLNGWLVTYPMKQTLNACYPRELLWSLSNEGTHYTHDVSVWFSGQAQRNFLPVVLEADRRRGELALRLLDEDPDVVVVNLTSIDRTSHCYWQELEEGSNVSATESAVFQAYLECDQIVGRLIERMTERTSLLLFSEIGFGPLRAYCSINDCLAKVGFLTTERSIEGRTVRWEDTVAFEAVQGTHGVNINLEGRYVHGKVKAEDYRQLREEAMAALRESINPYTGLNLFRQVLPREEVYAGESVEKTPDIILDPADERYLPLGDPFWASHVCRTRQSGWHRRDSYWAGMGGSFRAAESGRTASLLDIAPTICRLLDVEVPHDFAGSALSEVA